MNCFASAGLPDEAYVSVRSKLIDETDGEIDRPTRHRRKTNENFIYVMAFCYVLLAGMLIYCGVNGPASGHRDNFEYGHFNNDPDSIWDDVMHQHLQLGSTDMLYMVAFILAIIMVTILLLRYFIGVFIWTMLVLGSLTALGLTIVAWAVFFQVKNDSHGVILLPLAATVVTFVIVFLIYATRKRIQMIIQVFKEASKAIGDMPQLFIQPAISFVAFLVSAIGFSSLSTVVFKAGIKENGYFNPDDIVICTYIFLSWGGIWLTYFFKGCQSMVIGGTVATWYYRRDKSDLGSPMWRTTSNMLRYHMGTVAFGSLLMLLMEIIKSISDFFTKRKIARVCCCCCACICCMLNKCIKNFEEIIKYFTKMSYIMTAIHGVSFCTGCREGMILLLNHAFSLMQLKCFCKFVLGLLQLIIVAIVIIVCRNIARPDSADFVSVVSGIFAFFAANTFLSLYNIAIDTIFLCYCEDLAENDGVSKPYFMSRELMCFMEDSKRTLSDIVRDMAGEVDMPGRVVRGHDDGPNAPSMGPI